MQPSPNSRPTRTVRPRIPDETFHARLATGGRPLFVVSDLHLGLSEGFGFPPQLEDTLARAIAERSRDGAIIVLGGDIIEDGQGPSPLAVLARTPQLLEAIGEASARPGGLYYVVGNHDPCAEQLRGELPWQVVPGMVVDETLLLVHGDVLDVGLRGTAAGRAARLHGSVQRCLGTPIALPLDTHDTLRNRMVVGLGASSAAVLRAVGFRRWVDHNLDYLVSLELGRDPHFVVAALAEAILPPAITTVFAGHTHHPGEAHTARHRYLNSGAWSDHMATAITWERGDGHVFDLVRGTTHGTEAYDGWQHVEPWTTWWARARPQLAGVRVVGQHLRTALRRTPTRPAPRARTLALPSGSPQDDTMIVRFTERLRGALHPMRADARPITLELDGATRADFVQSCLVDLEGKIDVAGLAATKPAIGTLRLGPRTWEYDVGFVGDDGFPYRLLVRKVLRALDLVQSFTSATGEILDARGRSLGPVELEFELGRDLGPLLRSFTTRPVVVERERSPRVDLVDPHALGPLAGADQRVIAVTGAAGHLGFTIAGQLVTRGYRVLGLVRDAAESPRRGPASAGRRGLRGRRAVGALADASAVRRTDRRRRAHRGAVLVVGARRGARDRRADDRRHVEHAARRQGLRRPAGRHDLGRRRDRP